MDNNKEDMPKHIGIILDGNRRYAKKLGLDALKGHDEGAKKVHEVFDWCKELDIRELTLYAFSLKNFDRESKQVKYLMTIFEREFTNMKTDKRIHDDKIRLNMIGRIDELPEGVSSVMNELMQITKNYDNYIINFALAYDGRAEIVDAGIKIARQVKQGTLNIEDIAEETFNQNMYLRSEPDLIIRTSGEQRISGFLLWQGSYAELYFSDRLWPEFQKQDLEMAIKEYCKRKRRFGK